MFASRSPLAMQQAKEMTLRGMDAALDTGLALETKALHQLFPERDQKEGIVAFIEKRKPKFQGKRKG
jgi:enoyl-CoA hydratase/carnithine racemase